MSLERYKQIAREQEVLFGSPIPMNTTKEECIKAKQTLNDLRAMDAKEIGVNPVELEGLIDLADMRFRALVRAKR